MMSVVSKYIVNNEIVLLMIVFVFVVKLVFEKLIIM